MAKSTFSLKNKENLKLKDYLKFYSLFGLDELQIVRQYIEDKHLETEFSQMAIELTANQLYRERARVSDIKWIIGDCNSFGGKIHHSEYTPEQNARMDSWIAQLAIKGELSEDTQKEIAEMVPSMPTPFMCYRSLIYYINKVIGVRFADQTEDEERLLNDVISRHVDEILAKREQDAELEDDSDTTSDGVSLELRE